MWFDFPNHSIRCAKILVVAPSYSSECTFTLLTLFAPKLPFDWFTKLAAALVLFAVKSAMLELEVGLELGVDAGKSLLCAPWPAPHPTPAAHSSRIDTNFVRRIKIGRAHV